MALVFTGTKLGTKFNIKDKTSKEHQHDLAYSVVCPDLNCNEGYNGETGRRLIEKVHEHSGKDVNSHVSYRHSTCDFYLIRRDLALETFGNKFSYLNHSIITSKYKLSD